MMSNQWLKKESQSCSHQKGVASYGYPGTRYLPIFSLLRGSTSTRRVVGQGIRRHGFSH
jgi:hypothetical protein